jgi:hypothetical protein
MGPPATAIHRSATGIRAYAFSLSIHRWSLHLTANIRAETVHVHAALMCGRLLQLARMKPVRDNRESDDHRVQQGRRRP